MNEPIKFLNNIQSRMNGLKTVALVAIVFSAIVALGSMYYAQMIMSRSADNIYIIDEGAALEARRTNNESQRDLEVIDHVTRFHELFYNVAPNITTINQNIARALELADQSAYQYFQDLKEQRYFNTLVNINASQQIMVDSVKVDIIHYPYTAHIYSSLYVLRESTVTLYSMESECSLTNVQRSHTNPHGLMIGNFYATKPQLVNQKKR